MGFDLSKNNTKEFLLIKATAFFWIIAKLMSWKLWMSERLFPVIPPFNFSPHLSNDIHFTLFLVSLIGLISLVIFIPKKEIVFIVFVIELCSCLLDQMRWQPWEYQYLLIFSFYLFYKKNSNQFIELLTFLIGITYVYSGLHKFNGGFLYSIWENMILKTFFNIDKSIISNICIHYSGLLLPIFETTIGLNLLIRKNKFLSIYLAIGMHVILLIILIGNRQNNIVWPWNLAMIFYLWVLSSKNNSTYIKNIFFKNYFNVVIVILVGILPSLSFYGLWDNYLSFNLYSGNVKHLTICYKKSHIECELKPFVSTKKRNFFCVSNIIVNPNKLALKELNVPIYPEVETFIKLKKEWNKRYSLNETKFVYYWYPYKKENYIEIK